MSGWQYPPSKQNHAWQLQKMQAELQQGACRTSTKAVCAATLLCR